ncbi:MAG: DUF1684 domain-containing protein [Betaproteobacteria bacterium]|nr:DUF1684 domain-containing protein [Betaproteobacteria bacterium]
MTGRDESMRRFAAWRKARIAELAGPESWLGLVGLHPIEPGINPVGRGADCTVALPGGPARAGELVWAGDTLEWHPAGGEPLMLASDRQGKPTVVELGPLAFFVIDRDGRLAVRVRDREWASKTTFVAPECFPYQMSWRVNAAWQRLDSPVTMEVPNVSGDLREVQVDHRAVFEVDGEPLSLLPVSVENEKAFFVFRDRSSGRETYGAGRFLKAPIGSDGKVVLDFNRAYSPPCAFTPFATCPLPPPENWLPVAVTAGEKKPASPSAA